MKLEIEDQHHTKPMRRCFVRLIERAAAGLYTTLQPEASAQLGNQKADQVRSTGVTRVASANPGCEMQLRSYLEDNYEIAHPIEWYLAALVEDSKGGTTIE